MNGTVIQKILAFLKAQKILGNSIQFNSILLFTLYKIFTLYIVRQEYTNKVEEEGKKKKINVLGRSVWWSEEFSFRANYRHIMIGNT